jgi:hypothetical protein
MCVRVVLGMGEADRDLASNLYHHDIYSFRDLVVALEVTVTQSLRGSCQPDIGKQGKSSMTYEINCAPVAGADVDGFRFYRDQLGTVIARCVRCRVGFTVRSETAEAVRPRMLMHLESAHGWR